MANRQKEILNKLAIKHGLTIGQAEEIWKLLTDKIRDVISDTDKQNEDGTYDVDKFKNVNIHNFGKFVFHKKLIHAVNTKIKKRNEKTMD